MRNFQKIAYGAVTEESVIFSLYNSLRCEKYVFMGYISKKAMVLPQSSKMSLEVKLVNWLWVLAIYIIKFQINTKGEASKNA